MPQNKLFSSSLLENQIKGGRWHGFMRLLFCWIASINRRQNKKNEGKIELKPIFKHPSASCTIKLTKPLEEQQMTAVLSFTLHASYGNAYEWENVLRCQF